MSRYQFYYLLLKEIVVVTAPLAGRLSDIIMIIRWKKRRGGVWYPKDRLRATIPRALFLALLPTIFTGLLIEFIPGKAGLVLNLVCLFVNGFGVRATIVCSAFFSGFLS